MKKKEFNYYIVIFVIIILLFLTLLLEDKMGSRIVTILTVGTAIVGAVSIFIQYKRDKEVNQASFILEYAKYFYSLNGVEEAMLLLDQYRLGNKEAIKKLNYMGVINYLFWCEELAALYQKNVVDIESIDNLFSYLFFLITNNEYIQETELCPQAEFYKGTFYLHKVWTKYKKDTHQPIINEKESLEKVKEYQKIAQKGDLSNRKLY